MLQRFTARAVVVGDRTGTVVPDAVLDVEDGVIRWVGRAADAPEAPDAEVTALPGVLTPGMVNTHSHAPMLLFRGQGEGLPLDRWLNEVMWPREARLTPEDVEVAMTAASAEMLRHGVTTSVEMYFHPDRMAAAVRRTGARGVITHPLLGLPGFGSFDEQLAAAAASGGTGDDQVEWGIGPHAAYTVPLPVLTQAAEVAREHGMLLTTHVAETATEGNELLAQHGQSVPQLLAAHDVLGGRVLANHCVHMDDGDLELWREYDVAVAHCPGSNTKLASGTARLRDMLDLGIRVGMGTDGPASNDNLDLFEDLRLAAQLARLRERDATALTAPEAFWLATGAAAAAIDREDLGQLTAGRRADLVHVDSEDIAFVPVGEPTDLLTHLVWSVGSRHVRDTWVAGRQVVRDGVSTTVDEAELRADVQTRAMRLAGR
ncbi:amidohydrolase family protein [Modestobacter roseus]|uniref:5-methylthioadenosine/S-adenosylhomocysteine deaminase n=1 Tax=Modestobacter roseus TaxID=1181884 RepID=A0A562IUT9_9ACTN|nr:amidohydrolase family protein [Modestobacter roseus]MQA33598.1 amidohydrolase family protein [Modestobacter roseus]TWH74769.1 5-methylthioadenosine/S-adenosylhomocysteine deaminase [Modestobacter roseus]